jgi:DNA-binding transcriptional LysR family regulator
MITPQLQAGKLELVLDDYGPPAVPVHVIHKEPGQTSARIRAVVDHLVENLRKDIALIHGRGAG